MLNKRALIILFMTLLVSGPLFASEKPTIDLDPWGNYYFFWLAPSTIEGLAPSTIEGLAASQTSTEAIKELRFSSSNLTDPQTLYSFSQEVTSFDIKVENNLFYLAFAAQDSLQDSSNIYLTFSKDNGQTFSPPLLISEQGKNPCLSLQNELVAIAWEGKDGIYYCNSENSALSFTETKIVQITGEALSNPTLLIDPLKNMHLVFLSKDLNTDLKQVYYAQLATPEPRALFESQDNLINLGIKKLTRSILNWGQRESLLVFWQKEYLERQQTYCSVSLDLGQNFSAEKYLELEQDLLDLHFINGKFSALTYEEAPTSDQMGQIALQEIELPLLSIPHILSPYENAVLNLSNLKLVYTLPSSDLFICKIDLAQEKDFPFSETLSFEQLHTAATQENFEFSFPEDPLDGTYFLRTQIWDGLSSSPRSQTLQFRIDNAPPQILSLEAERVENQVSFKGGISELPAWLSINQKTLFFESLSENPTFESWFDLVPGQNLFTFVLSDEASNLWIATQEVFFDPAIPEIALLKPEENEWFKPDSVIFIQAQVTDLQGDIQDGAEAQITLNSQTLAQSLVFDQQEGMLYGFISLPPELGDGRYSGTISLSDQAGNQGQADFNLKTDGSPPLIPFDLNEPCFVNSQTDLVISAWDEGAGLDPSGTLIKISGVSLEGTISVEAQKIIFSLDSPLAQGTYEVEMVARDLVGNIGEPTLFCLVVDTTPPQLTLLGSYESSTSKNSITLQARVEEETNSALFNAFKVNIYNNQQIFESFDLSEDSFSREINLIPGQNQILIEILDKSGNKDSANLDILANFSIAASSSLIQSCVHGPNPFSPKKNLPGAFSSHGKGMIFSYALSQPADIKILIFDLTGTLIWSKEIKNAASGITAWSGVDNFGQLAKNGIYPYIFSARADGKTEIKRGKIMVYQ